MKIQVADVTIRHREVELPEQCPHCEHDLTTSAEDGEIRLTVETLDEVSEEGAIIVDSGEVSDLTWFESTEQVTTATLDVRCGGCNMSVLDEPGTLRQALPDGVTVS